MTETLNFPDFFSSWARSSFGRGAAKKIACAVGISHRTAEAYTRAHHPSGMSAETLVALMRRNAELRAEIYRMTEEKP